MDKRVFGYIESELYDYRETKERIKTIEADIIMDSGVSYDEVSTGSTNKISRPTENKVIDLTTNAQLDKAKRTVDAIERALKRLDDEEVRLFELKYTHGIHWRKIIEKHIPMSDRTYRRKKKKIVFLVAKEMGFSID